MNRTLILLLAGVAGLAAGCSEKNPPACRETARLFQTSLAEGPDPAFEKPVWDKVLALAATLEGAKGGQCDAARRGAQQIKMGRAVAAEQKAKQVTQRAQDAAAAHRSCRSACESELTPCQGSCRCSRRRQRFCRERITECKADCASARDGCLSDCDAFAKGTKKGPTRAVLPKDVPLHERPALDVGSQRFNLRGPACAKGRPVVQTWVTHMPKAHVTFNVGVLLEGFMAYTYEERVEKEIVTCDEARPEQTEARYEYQRHKTGIEGKERIIAGPLHGQIVMATYNPKTKAYDRVLLDRTPSSAQAEALLEPTTLNGFEFPAQKVAVGHRWSLNDTQIRAWAGLSPKARYDGSVKYVFDKVVVCGDEQCAVMSVTVDLNTRAKQEQVEMKMKGVAVRALTSNKDLLLSLAGTLATSAYVEENGDTGRLKTEGKASLTMTGR